MQKLSADVDICATQVMSTLQGIRTLQSGVKYISVFYCFMLMGELMRTACTAVWTPRPCSTPSCSRI